MSKEINKNNMDVWSIFKTLDEYEMPETLNENVNGIAKVDGRQGMESLVEEFYDFNEPAEVEELKKVREDEVAQAKLAKIEKIVDLDADTVEDLQPSYIGKTIIQCPKCMTLFYKDKADLVADENDPTIVNVNEVCQHCGNDTGYTVIGQVAEETPIEDNIKDEIPNEDTSVEDNIEEKPEEINAEEIDTEKAPVEEENKIEKEDTEIEKIPELDEIEPKNESLNEKLGNREYDHRFDRVIGGWPDKILTFILKACLKLSPFVGGQLVRQLIDVFSSCEDGSEMLIDTDTCIQELEAGKSFCKILRDYFYDALDPTDSQFEDKAEDVTKKLDEACKKLEKLNENLDYDKIWERWDNLKETLGADRIVDEVANYFDTDTLGDFIESVEKDYDIYSEDEELEESLTEANSNEKTLGDELDKDPFSPANMKLFFNQKWEDVKEDLEIKDVDEIDENSLNKCITEGFKKAGINYQSFEAANCQEKDGKILIEGKATMAGGDKIDYTIQLDHIKSSENNVRLFSENYTLDCKKDGNKLITESFDFKKADTNR